MLWYCLQGDHIDTIESKGTIMMDPQPSQQLSTLAIGGWITQAIHVAAELGIADLLANGPQTPEHLAARARANSDGLHRVLRALATLGVFKEDAEGRFSLTPLAESLRSDTPMSLRSFAIMAGSEFYQSWGSLLHSVRTGEPGFQQQFGVPFFQYMTEHPDRHAIYDDAMMVHGIAETEPMLNAYDFSGFRILADLGGGNGRMLAAILNRYPAIEGILFDLPTVAERSRKTLGESGLSARCRFVGGDFFSSVPPADAYVMRHILHDWDDAAAISILRNCRKAMNPEGRILVVETVLPPLNAPCFGKWLDLMMLIVGGRERTGRQYRHLFSQAGLQLSRIIPTAHEVSIIEVVQPTPADLRETQSVPFADAAVRD